MLRARSLLLLFVTMLCVACMAPQRTQMVAVDMNGWSRRAVVEVENSDTLSLRQLAIALRYNSTLQPSEIALKIGVITPEGRTFEEPFTLELAGAKRATTVSQSILLPYRHDVVFAESGCYTFTFEPLSCVCGVEAVGVEITKRE